MKVHLKNDQGQVYCAAHGAIASSCLPWEVTCDRCHQIYESGRNPTLTEQVWITREVKSEIKVRAKKEGCTMGALVIEAWNQYKANNPSDDD